jgi:hypothetical protein
MVAHLVQRVYPLGLQGIFESGMGAVKKASQDQLF